MLKFNTQKIFNAPQLWDLKNWKVAKSPERIIDVLYGLNTGILNHKRQIVDNIMYISLEKNCSGNFYIAKEPIKPEVLTIIVQWNGKLYMLDNNWVKLIAKRPGYVGVKQQFTVDIEDHIYRREFLCFLFKKVVKASNLEISIY